MHLISDFQCTNSFHGITSTKPFVKAKQSGGTTGRTLPTTFFALLTGSIKHLISIRQQNSMQFAKKYLRNYRHFFVAFIEIFVISGAH